jgi:CRP-like cAMP-binding protein
MALTASELAGILPPRSVFGSCNEAELADLLACSTEFTTKPGQILLEQGGEGDALLVLVEGVARVSRLAENGREIVLDYAEPGTMLGEIALFDGEPRTASVTSLWKGRALRVGRAAFERLIEKHPHIALRIMREMAKRLREMDETIESDRAFTTEPRLARFLKRLTEQKAHGARLTADLSQSELGNFVGISRENINRQLSAWASDGIIELAHGKIRILDPDYLSQIAASGD